MRDEIELHRSHEIMVDEDILSAGARASLEQVGTAVGFVCVLALLMVSFARAGRLFSPAAVPEDRDVRAAERRALDASGGARDV